MFEALPVVIPTMRDVARGTLRPVGNSDDAATAAGARTAAILLDARTPGMPALGAVYGELELYLQAANIASLRLPRRSEGTVALMLDILAGVTLLRSHGCERVILIVAAEGAAPSWQQSHAQSLARLLDLIRRQHGGSAQELIGAIGDLVKTIRVVADSVIGVATVLMAEPRVPQAGGSRVARNNWLSTGDTRVSSPPAPSASPKALLLPLRGSDDHVSAVSQLYLWCHALAYGTQAATCAAEQAQVLEDAVATADVPRSAALRELRVAATEFHEALHWLDERWSEMVGDMARQLPHPAARTLAAASHAEANPPHGNRLRASRDAWKYLDTSTQRRWLELCRMVFASVPEPASAVPNRRVD